jgi:hypothetical protein
MPIDPGSASSLFRFGTKAETLERLRPVVKTAEVPPLWYFTVADWMRDRSAVLTQLQRRFPAGLLAIRSSARIEDAASGSMAGAFLSRLRVAARDADQISTGIAEVVASLTGDPRDQVLVQAMVSDVAVSGVIMTYDMVHGAPYYCIDYDEDSGRTDLVTSGAGVHKGLLVYRHADESMIRSPRIGSFLRLAREVEEVTGCPALDIEFGMGRNGQLFLLQARRIALAGTWHPVTERRVARQLAHIERFVEHQVAEREGLLGRRSALAIMPDWNPAEIIGTTPRPLAASLYRHLITRDIWRLARADMGYRPVPDGELMVVLNHHPYIDVRSSFNSFLPAGVQDAIGARLVEAWLARLEAHPEYHDKVEFDIVPTCLDFCFHADFTARYPGLLSEAELLGYRDALRELTGRCLTRTPDNTLDLALTAVRRLEHTRAAQIDSSDAYAQLAQACRLLWTCRQVGTRSFAVAARHAFIAEAILRSALRRGAIEPERLTTFKRSIRTVTGGMVEEYAQVCRGTLARTDFLARYGHLRPGTYEITSLRYDERDDLFLDNVAGLAGLDAPAFELRPEERRALEALLSETALGVHDAGAFIEYARAAIAGREDVKFRFTKTLSDALACLVRWGELHGLSRDDLSYLRWEEIENSLTLPVMDDLDRHFLDSADAGRRSMASAHAFKLAHIIFGVRDVYVATLNRSVPNFVGTGSACAQVVELNASTPASVDIRGHIVCIENADPGFDWIFTKGPAGLITCFGGANSHMAIRSAELGLPAAIGCGDQIYERVIRGGRVELNCAGRILRPVHGD